MPISRYEAGFQEVVQQPNIHPVVMVPPPFFSFFRVLGYNDFYDDNSFGIYGMSS